MKHVFLGGLRRTAVLTVVLAPQLILFSDMLYSVGIALSVSGYDSLQFWDSRLPQLSRDMDTSRPRALIILWTTQPMITAAGKKSYSRSVPSVMPGR